MGLHLFLSLKNLFHIFVKLTAKINNFKTNKTMTKEMTKVTPSYESPACDIVDINTEGVLCGSMQQLEEYDGEYEW